MKWPWILADAFWVRVAVGDPDECWPWRRAKQSAGYGHLVLPGSGRTFLAHRVAYALHYGEVPDELVIDHLCENPLCCNPAHLEAVPHAVNLMRGIGQRTHCRRGHALDGIRRNTVDGITATSRYCKTCNRERQRRARRLRRSPTGGEN